MSLSFAAIEKLEAVYKDDAYLKYKLNSEYRMANLDDGSFVTKITWLYGKAYADGAQKEYVLLWNSFCSRSRVQGLARNLLAEFDAVADDE